MSNRTITISESTWRTIERVLSGTAEGGASAILRQSAKDALDEFLEAS